ncbi:MAG: general secretion pathway protein GspE [Planctomycetota bacterium]|nr:MAG: general secretion pathway protein GspE [Planctomycetota bacterium]
MLRRKNKKAGGKSTGGNAEGTLPKIEFKPPIADKQQEQGVLIACRGMPQWPAALQLAAQAIKSRAEQILLDFTAQGVAVRIRVDGIWESLPPMDRPTGDGVLVIFKKLCDLNPNDRRSKQHAVLPVKYKGVDWLFDFVSQGVPTGERVLIRIEPKKPVLTTLADLGMRQKMQEQLRNLLNASGHMFLFSAPPGHGLPTTWRVGLEAADRFVRDFHSIEDVHLNEPELINITKHTFDSAAGETPLTVLKSLLLKQPDVLVLPDLVDGEVCKLMCEEALEEGRSFMTRIHADSAVQALIKLMARFKGSARELVKACNGVLNQRLVRRLCLECRQPFQPSPQLLQKLGIPPGRVQVLYQPTIPPPPEQRVDANGRPLEIEICGKCGGRGYYGRAAIFELLVLNDDIRKAFLNDPRPASVLAVARKHGFLTLQEEAILAVATGMTSLQEIQRVLTPPKK